LRFSDRRIHLIAGKGGVGRTLVSVALAHAVAQTGKAVLLAEVGSAEVAHSAVAPHFGLSELTDVPRLMAPGIFGCHLTATTGQEAFGRSILPAGPIVRAALKSHALRKFLIAAPALFELGLMYHLLCLLDARGEGGRLLYPCIVIDMPATGHTMALADLPEVVLRLVPRGPIANAMRAGQAYLNDPKTTAAWIVTLPEHLPVTEAIELLAGLRRAAVPTGGVFLNRHVDDPFTAEERAALDPILADRAMQGGDMYRRVAIARDASSRLRASVDVPVFDLPEIVADAGVVRAGLTTRLVQAEGS
jgi:anion-transporting  ArsA/GET3 family ATPase